MLFLKFTVGTNLCALEAAQIVEVLPRVDLVPIPGAAHATDGVFSYHGVAVPVIDLSARLTGRPATRRLSTRVILARSPRTAALRGLIAEHVTETFQRDPADFVSSLDAAAGAPAHLPAFAAVALDGAQLIYRIDVDLLTASARHVA